MEDALMEADDSAQDGNPLSTFQMPEPIKGCDHSQHRPIQQSLMQQI
jgi:hypothetical protein